MREPECFFNLFSFLGFDDFPPDLKITPASVEFILPGIFRIDPFFVKIHIIHVGIGHSPGYAVVMPTDDKWRTR